MGMLGKFVAGAAGSLGKQMEESRQTEEKTKAAASLEELRGRIQAQLEEKRQTFESGQTDKKLAFEAGQTDKKITAESTERGLDRTQRGELAAYEASRADARERAAADRADKQFRLDQQRLAVEIRKAQAAESKGERVDPAKLLTGIDQADKSLAEREALATTAEEKAQIREDRIAFDRLRKSIIMGGMGIRPLAAEGQPSPGDSKGSIDQTKDKGGTKPERKRGTQADVDKALAEPRKPLLESFSASRSDRQATEKRRLEELKRKTNLTSAEKQELERLKQAYSE